MIFFFIKNIQQPTNIRAFFLLEKSSVFDMKLQLPLRSILDDNKKTYQTYNSQDIAF